MHGDLKERFENEVIHNPDGDERASYMSTMNIMCGHVEIECAYTMFHLGHECHEKHFTCQIIEKFCSLMSSWKFLTQQYCNPLFNT